MTGSEGAFRGFRCVAFSESRNNFFIISLDDRDSFYNKRAILSGPAISRTGSRESGIEIASKKLKSIPTGFHLQKIEIAFKRGFFTFVDPTKNRGSST